MKKISFLVPVYNKADTLRDTFSELRAAAQLAGLRFEIIAIDDGSSDRSLEVLLEATREFPELRTAGNPENLGFARTYFRCAAMAEGDFVMYVSAENEIDRATLAGLLALAAPGRMVLQTCSNSGERGWFRGGASRGFTRAMNWINRTEVGYYNGFNIYPADAVRSLQIRESSFAFQAEIVSRLLGVCTPVEVPIRCGFRDGASTALRPANVAGVLRYLARKAIRRAVWTR